MTASSTGQLAVTVRSFQPLNGTVPSSGAFVVHLGPSLSAPVAGLPIACADLATWSAHHPILGLQALSDQTGALRGSATLLYNPSTQTLTVHAQASGLAPFSQHAAHIHLGSCAAQGPVRYMLPDLIANAAGNVNEVTMLWIRSADVAGLAVSQGLGSLRSSIIPAHPCTPVSEARLEMLSLGSDLSAQSGLVGSPSFIHTWRFPRCRTCSRLSEQPGEESQQQAAEGDTEGSEDDDRCAPLPEPDVQDHDEHATTSHLYFMRALLLAVSRAGRGPYLLWNPRSGNEPRGPTLTE